MKVKLINLHGADILRVELYAENLQERLDLAQVVCRMYKKEPTLLTLESFNPLKKDGGCSDLAFETVKAR